MKGPLPLAPPAEKKIGPPPLGFWSSPTYDLYWRETNSKSNGAESKHTCDIVVVRPLVDTRECLFAEDILDEE